MADRPLPPPLPDDDDWGRPDGDPKKFPKPSKVPPWAAIVPALAVIVIVLALVLR